MSSVLRRKEYMERTILHADCNCFYASVEMLHHPEYEGKPLAVGGSPESRHGIILTANYIAKKLGVKTGQALWQAKQACPDLIIVRPDYDQYLRFSRMVREIYGEYTDRQEPFGIDECWLDMTESAQLYGDGAQIAETLRRRVRYELGITISVGVSWNKIYAKLGSDYKKPDAVTVISRDNYKEIVWPLPASDLLYVGRATGRHLARLGIYTIGELAAAPADMLQAQFGKIGPVLGAWANGLDDSPVVVEDYEAPIKSIGNSTTTPRDLVSDKDVQMIFMALCENVCMRLRANGFRCRVVEMYVRDNGLYHFSRQKTLSRATNITDEMYKAVMELFLAQYDWEHPIRSLGVRGASLVGEDAPEQLEFGVKGITVLVQDEEHREKLARMEDAVDEIRRRFGYTSIQRALEVDGDESLRRCIRTFQQGWAAPPGGGYLGRRKEVQGGPRDPD